MTGECMQWHMNDLFSSFPPIYLKLPTMAHESLHVHSIGCLPMYVDCCTYKLMPTVSCPLVYIELTFLQSDAKGCLQVQVNTHLCTYNKPSKIFLLDLDVSIIFLVTLSKVSHDEHLFQGYFFWPFGPR